ncbi:Beta-glucanase [Lachnellula cervina]|uniref:Beta-glucanase n=1 Tax=Lachnellula cervina TaxID=1316786 RepID=A0A7D8UPV5_9HELO|nr:Beta-glucanase [Lachnellula cervina]
MPLIINILLFIISCLVAPSAGNCECGYTAAIGSSTLQTSNFLFTDLIESDFLHIKNISLDTDWRRQSFAVTPEAGRGPYGMNFTVNNVFSNPIPDLNNWTGHGLLGGDAGLQFTVDSGIPEDGYVKVSELDSSRTDLLWGTYRASMKLSLTPGTCAAFFWYFNDSQEIDMEFLSSQFIVENNTYPVNLVLQSVQSVQAGFNAAGSPNFKLVNLPFNPTVGYHEYRFDFVPGKVIFLADGHELATMDTSAVPTQPGHLILTNWSNGNDKWSFGPPPEDSVISVAYVKAYFNSSLSDRQSAWAMRCKGSISPDAICAIPDLELPPNPAAPASSGTISTPATFFFSDQKNMTVNQTVYHKSKGTTTPLGVLQQTIGMLVTLTLFLTILL